MIKVCTALSLMFASFAHALFWFLSVQPNVESDALAVVLALVYLSLVTMSLLVYRDGLNPIVQIAAYSLFYFLPAMLNVSGNLLVFASITAFFGYFVFGIFVGSVLKPFMKPLVFTLVKPYILKYLMVLALAVSMLLFGYLVWRLGGLMTMITRPWVLSAVSRRENLGIFFSVPLFIIALSVMWPVYLKRNLVYWLIVALSIITSALIFRRTDILFAVFAVLVYQNYFVQRLRLQYYGLLLVFGVGLLIFNQFRYLEGSGFVMIRQDTVLIDEMLGDTQAIFNSYAWVVTTSPDYSFFVAEGADPEEGLRFLLPQFLFERRTDYITLGQVMANYFYGTKNYGTPFTLFGLLLVSFPDFIAPILVIPFALLWGNIYGGVIRTSRIEGRDKFTYVIYLTSMFLAFVIFRNGDWFNFIKISYVYCLLLLVPASFIYDGDEVSLRSLEPRRYPSLHL